MMRDAYDVVVVGAGAAGLTGALSLVRARRSVLVIDAGEPRNGNAAQVHNYLTRDGTPPAQLLAAGREEVLRYGGEIVDGRVEATAAEPDGFRVRLAGGPEVHARRMLVATGLVDELPDIPGLTERWGRDVLHCPHCHGWEFRDRRIGVLSTRQLSAHRAAVWRQWSGLVLLLTNGGPAPAGEEAEWLAALNISTVEGLVTALVVTDDSLTGVRLESGDMVGLDALVVSPRYLGRAEVLAALGVNPEPAQMGGEVVGSQVPAGFAGATSVPGVWVAGNVSDVRDHVVMAAAAGLNAAIAINADLVAADTRTAVERYRRESTIAGASTE